jgi:hypothetical protein
MSDIDKEIIEAMAAKGWLIPQTEREVQMAEQLLKQDKVIKLQAAALEVWKSGKANKPGVVLDGAEPPFTRADEAALSAEADYWEGKIKP